MEERLGRGISFSSEDDARLVLEQYRQQIASGSASDRTVSEREQGASSGEGARSAGQESSSSGEGA